MSFFHCGGYDLSYTCGERADALWSTEIIGVMRSTSAKALSVSMIVVGQSVTLADAKKETGVV